MGVPQNRAPTGAYQSDAWQIVTDAKGFESIHETDEDGRPGDLVAHVFGDNAALVRAAPQLCNASVRYMAAVAALGARSEIDAGRNLFDERPMSQAGIDGWRELSDAGKALSAIIAAAQVSA